jgi:hypothetical protein
MIMSYEPCWCAWPRRCALIQAKVRLTTPAAGLAVSFLEGRREVAAQ